MRRVWPILLGAMVVATGSVHAQGAPDITVTPTGRLMYQFHTSSVEGADATFEFRRVRIAADIRVGEAIRGFIEPEYAQGDLKLRQAWVDYRVDPAFAVRAGQFKKPFSLLQLTSSLNHPMIERAVRIRGLAGSYEAIDDASGAPILPRADGVLLGEEQFLLEELGYQSYDMGLAVHGELGAFGYEAGVFNGMGADAVDANAEKALAARVTYAPIDHLTLGAAVSRTDLVLEDAEPMQGTAFEVDAEWGGFRTPGLHLMTELAFGDNVVDDDDFMAVQGIAAWFAPLSIGRVEGVEPVLRGSWGDPARDVANNAGLLVTPGINLYFHGRNRLMANVDLFMPEGDRFDGEQSIKVQAQLHF